MFHDLQSLYKKNVCKAITCLFVIVLEFVGESYVIGDDMLYNLVNKFILTNLGTSFQVL